MSPFPYASPSLPACLRHRFAIPLLLALLTTLAYLNSFPAVFIQDDIHIVKTNPLVQSLDVVTIFTSDYWHGMENSGLYRPLTIFSLALNRIVAGNEPWGYHLVNVLLHIAVTVLVWLTLPRWGASLVAAGFAALWFAAHPIHAEVINIAVGRSELLVAFFFLVALYAARVDSRRNNVVVCLCFALAMLAKEHAIVLLAVIPLCDAHQDGFAAWRRRWPLYLGLLVVTVLWLLMRQFGVDEPSPRSLYSTTAVPLAYLPWDDRVLTALQYQWVYVAKLLVGYRLQTAYSLADLPPVIVSLWSVRAVLVLATTAAAFGAVVIGWRRRCWWALPAAAYVVTFAPTANIVMPIGVTMAERLAYLPSYWFAALFGATAAAVWELRHSAWRRLALAGLAGYLIFLAAFGVLHNRDFASEIRLWNREVQQNDADYLGWHSYTEVLNANSRYDEADQAYRRLLQMKPDFAGAFRSYYAFLYGRGRYREAIAQVEKSIQMSRQQGDVVGISYDLMNLAAAYIQLKDFTRALAYVQEPEAKLFVQQDVYFDMLGRALQGVGDHAAAVAAFEQIKSYKMDLNIPLYHGTSLLQLGRLTEAEAMLREAVDINPQPEAWNTLGVIHAQQGRRDQAIAAFEQAVRLEPDNRHYQDNLARARTPQ